MDQSLFSSPWVDHFQTRWNEAEEIQPLLESFDVHSALDHYRFVRQLFALTRLGSESVKARAQERLSLALQAPWTSRCQPTEAIRALAESVRKIPYFPIQYPSGAAPLCRNGFPRIAECCQLALLWAILGKEEAHFLSAAQKLAGWLLPLLEKGMVHLWSDHTNFQEEELLLSSFLLLNACGKQKEGDLLYRADLPKDPFFSFLFHQKVEIKPELAADREPLLGYRLLEGKGNRLALSFCGQGTPAGSMEVGGMNIPAFGPQGAPLNEMALFGVDTLLSDRGWFRSAASKELWLQLVPKVDEKGISLGLQQTGASPKQGVAFSFYVVADGAKVEGKVFKPQSIQRFSGQATRVEFEKMGSKIYFILDRSLKIELIPLAGGRVFWGASYLLAIWLPPFDGAITLQIENEIK